MRYAVQWLLSLIFIVQMYAVMIVVCAVCTPPALFWRGASYAWMQMFCRWTRYSAEKIIGLRTEVRGEIPKGATLIAAKHQSFLDIIVLFSVLDAPRFIMKKQLVSIPIMGWHALRIGCIPVDRGKRGQAINKMMADVTSGQEKPGQLIIYPQGTRVAPGADVPYKKGTAAIYSQLGQPCVPVATNVGVFWPRRRIYRERGLAVVEFLPPIPAGLSNEHFMNALENQIEAASDKLLVEAGFTRKTKV